jgi:hypothetical protein
MLELEHILTPIGGSPTPADAASVVIGFSKLLGA